MVQIRHGRITPCLSSVIKRLNIGLPLRLIWSQHSPIIRQEPIDLSFDISCLSPNSATTGEEFSLVSKFSEEGMAAIIPNVECLVNLVGLVDGIDCFLDIPETEKTVSEW